MTGAFLRAIDFNPRSPHGERPAVTDAQAAVDETISIHAPRTGSDSYSDVFGAEKHISIHAPRTGSDGDGTALPCRQAHFNPRSPHGERLI